MESANQFAKIGK